MNGYRVFLRARVAALRDRVRRGTPRERTLLVALGVVGVLILISVGVRTLHSGLEAYRVCAVREARVAVLRENTPNIEGALAERTRTLSGRRLSAAELLATVENTARESGLAADAGTPRTERLGRLTLHRVRLTLQSPGLRQLMEFDDRLHLRADGPSVERVLLESRSAGGELTATYELVACQPSE